MSILLSTSAYNKSVTVDDFRGISISPVVSKVFEHCILDRYEKFFITSDNQVPHLVLCTS